MSAPSPVLSTASAASDIKFPLFSPGQMLQHDDLTALADHTRMLMQLMLKSFFGCGVVCGLCVKAVFHCNKLVITVDPGVAVDCCGTLIHVTKPVPITIDPDCDLASLQGLDALWVVLRQYEKGCAPRTASCPSDDDEVKNVCTREMYWYEVQVRTTLPDCACMCIPPKRVLDQKPQIAAALAERIRAEAQGQSSSGDHDCYTKHRQGICECECAGPCDRQCGGEWVVLACVPIPTAKTIDVGKDVAIDVEHSVRRYVRPRLALDLGCGQDLNVQKTLQSQSGEVVQNVRRMDKPAPSAARKGAQRSRPGGKAPTPE